ncbi:MAG: hypothetical protein KDB53_05175 [Planctomycetes bacterium]|nr:hypothetical protein [Planctomycetota bacterium]
MMKLTFVTVVDQAIYEPGTAQLAAIARRHGWTPIHAPVDYGTAKEAFSRRLLENEPGAVVFRLTGETREVVQYMARVIREEAPTLPFVFHGPLCIHRPDSAVGVSDHSLVLAGEPETAFDRLLAHWPSQGGFVPEAIPGVWRIHDGETLRGPEALAFEPGRLPPPEIEVFGGASLFRHGTGASLFGETGVFPIETTVGCPAGPASNAALQSFNHPASPSIAPRRRPIDGLLDGLESVAGAVRHLEVRDRQFGFDDEHSERFLRELSSRFPNLGYSLRMNAEPGLPPIFDRLDSGRCRRIVLELDAPTPAIKTRSPGLRDPDRVRDALRRIVGAGIEAALLVSVGLPWETPADIRGKLDLIREEGVRRARFLPFEPRYADHLYSVCSDAKMLPTGEAGWNREVYHPLRQDCMPEEEWYQVWQECLDLAARLQVEHPSVTRSTTEGPVA